MIPIPKEMHSDYHSECQKVLAGLHSAYPQIPFRHLLLFEKLKDKSMGFATGDHTINLNSYWFSRPRKFFTDAILEARRTTPSGVIRWHGGIGGVDREFERLLTHEFGHLVASVTSDSSKFSATGHKAAIDSPRIAVSGYSLVDPDEWWSEVFCTLLMGGSQSPQVGDMRNFLEE